MSAYCDSSSKPPSYRPRASLCVVTLLLAAAALVSIGLAQRASASDWYFETLDGAGGANGRVYDDVGSHGTVTLYLGQPHVWYHDDDHGDLRHAWWTGATWMFETLDGAGGPNGRIDADVGGDNAVVLYGGQPHVWYHDDDHADLRHAWWTGATWMFETLDGAGGPNGRILSNVGRDNAVTLYGGRPHVWYLKSLGSFDLRHAWWTGSTWMFETLDGAGGPNGRTAAEVGSHGAVLLYSGQPHVWYHDDTNGNLRHGWWTGATWRFETLDGGGTGPFGRINADVGQNNAAALYGGHPHLWYSDNTNYDLRHAWWTGSHWVFETLDGHRDGPNGRVVGIVGFGNAVTLYGGRPHVWYYAPSPRGLRHAWWTGSAWWFEPLDGYQDGPNGQIDDHVGMQPAARLYGGQPHVWYYDYTNGDLRHAWYG